MKKVLKNEKGFTLVELIVVIVILGILAAVAIVSFIGQPAKAKIASDLSSASALFSAGSVYYAEFDGVLPDGDITEALVDAGLVLSVPDSKVTGKPILVMYDSSTKGKISVLSDGKEIMPNTAAEWIPEE